VRGLVYLFTYEDINWISYHHGMVRSLVADGGDGVLDMVGSLLCTK
jgi:hypothetical protein